MEATDEDKFNYIKEISDNIEYIKILTHSTIVNNQKGQNAMESILNLLEELATTNKLLIENQIIVLYKILENEEDEEEKRELIQEMRFLKLERKKCKLYIKALNSD